MQVSWGADVKDKTSEFMARLAGGRRDGQGSGREKERAGSRAEGRELHEQRRGSASVKGALRKMGVQPAELPM